MTKPAAHDLVEIEMIRQDMENLRETLGSEYALDLEESSFAGYEMVFVRQSGPGIEQELVLFLAEDVFFNIAYSASNEGTLEEYRDTAERSLETIIVIAQGPAPADEVQVQRVARYLRLAQLLAEGGDFENARSYLEEGLVEIPENQGLLEALELVNDEQQIPDSLGPGGLSN